MRILSKYILGRGSLKEGHKVFLGIFFDAT